jgi:Protein of unknown function (DUF4031)
MAAYVDDAIWHRAGRKWCHLLADDIDELHRFAAQIGINRLSFQAAATTPHYDLTAFERAKALARGAIRCNRREIVMVRRRLRMKSGQMAGSASYAGPAE